MKTYPHDKTIFGELPDDIATNNINIPTMATMHSLKRENQNWELLQEKLAFFPKDVVRETIKRTTQLAIYVLIFPMSKHIKSMFQMLRIKRINETQSTDTYFSSEKSIEGYNITQAFYGCTSGAIHVYSMKSKEEFYQIYQQQLKSMINTNIVIPIRDRLASLVIPATTRDKGGSTPDLLNSQPHP